MKKRIIQITIIGLFLLMLPLMAEAEIAWTLDDDGVLTISGTGTITRNYAWDNMNITSVVIESGITAIDKNAFWYLDP